MWDCNTLGYSFADQKWSVNTEIYSTYTKDSNGFASSGYLMNPKTQNDYKLALREGYLDDFEYLIEHRAHVYQDLVSSEDYNDVTFMLEPNVVVEIYNSDIQGIYTSDGEYGDASYFTRYYLTQRTIKGIPNKVVSVGLIKGTYYFRFIKQNPDATSNNHYGYYAGQPLPIAQTQNVSGRMHKVTISWDKHSSSQSADAPSVVTINCPEGKADEYALTEVRFVDESKVYANNTYASSIDYYYTPPTSGYPIQLTSGAGWWSDLVDYYPPAGSIEGTYKSRVTVHWMNNLAYVNAKCTTQTQMTIDYLAPFGIIVR